MSELYNISSSPHIRAKDTSAKIMLYVIIALLPASIFGVYNFGLRALLLIAVCIASCVASEWIFEKIVHKKSTITDFSAVLTGFSLSQPLCTGIHSHEVLLQHSQPEYKEQSLHPHRILNPLVSLCCFPPI